MPNLGIMEARRRAMVRVEMAYRRRIVDAMNVARARIGDAVLARRDFARATTAAVADMGVAVVSARRDAWGQTVTVTERFVEAQVSELRELGVRVPSLEAADLSRVRAWWDRVPAWYSALDALVGNEASRLALEGASPDVVYGRLLAPDIVDGRISVWRNAQNSAMLGGGIEVWRAGNLQAEAFYATASDAVGELRRQAVAAVDRRTTDCCLRVMGQIVAIRQPFRLTGEPRFADEMQDPPFHWNCRTSVHLYHDALERSGVPTDELVGRADGELGRRATEGIRREAMAEGIGL